MSEYRVLSGIVSSFYKRIVWREEISFPRSRGQILIQDSLPLSPAYSTQVLLKNTEPPWEEKHEKGAGYLGPKLLEPFTNNDVPLDP